MKIDATNSIAAIEIGVKSDASATASGANGSLTALHQTVAVAPIAPGDQVLSVVAPDGKGMIYRTVDAQGFVVEQIPSQQIVAMRQDMETLLETAEREHTTVKEL